MKKKVLFVSAINLFINGGGAQATRAYLDATLDIYGRENVTVMIESQIEIPPDYADLQFVKIPDRSSMSKVIGFFAGYMTRVTKPLLEYVKKHSAEYELCIINGSLTGGKSVRIIEKLGIRTVVIFHNYEVEYHKDNKTILSLKGHYLGSIRRAERDSFKNASLSFFLTQDDFKLFKTAYGNSNCKSFIIGTFDYKSKKKVTLSEKTKEFDFVISGSLNAYQTVVGIRDLFDNYNSILNRIISKPSVVIAGRNPSQQLRDYLNNQPCAITIVENPEDILSIVQKGTIYLCPTCIGGGLKLRAMDGLKCGIPVLSHSVSARGYEYYSDKGYFQIYNDEESFSQGLLAILQFIRNNNDINHLIEKDYYKYFGYESGVNRMKEALLSL